MHLYISHLKNIWSLQQNFSINLIEHKNIFQNFSNKNLI